MSTDEELVLPFPARLEPVSAIRSTLIASSLQSLKARDLLPRYRQLLPAELHDTVLHCIAGQWFPIAVGVAHYRACDELQLPPAEQRAIGGDVSRRINETFLGTVIHMAKGVGVSPWAVLPKSTQTYARVLRGGGTQVKKVGPKDAIVEVARVPLMDIDYFRNATAGLYEAALGMFAQRTHVRILAARSRHPSQVLTMLVSWV